MAPATPPAPTHHATVIVPAPAQPPHHVTVVTMGPTSVINTVSTSRQNLDTIVQVRIITGQTFEIVPGWEGFQIQTLEGAVVTDITRHPSPSLCRQSSTSRAPRGKGAWARRSSGGRSSSPRGASCPTRRAQTRLQTATGPTTAHCPEFIP